MWNKVYWELIKPAVKIRTLRARLKFEAYDSKGAVVAGDRGKADLTQKPICSVPGQSPQLPWCQDVTDSQPELPTERDEGSESLVLIDIEDVTCNAVQNGSFQNRGEITVEMMDEHVGRAPKKMVSIKDEPEIMCFGNKRRKTVGDRRISNLVEKERELRPLRSILKVGSNLGERSYVNVKPTKDYTMI